MRPILHGSTDQSTVVRIVDATDGSPETGVTTATGGLAFWYRRELGAKTAISGLSDLATLSTAHADGGLLHISDGYYRIDPPDAAWASGQQGVIIGGSATGMVVIGVYHPLVAYDGQNATSLGLSRLDAAMSSRAAETTVDTVESSLSTLTTRIPDTLSLANINAEVDTALNTAIPGSPTADSINERIKAIDDKLPSGNIGDATSANQTTIINATDTVESSLSTLTTRIPDTISLANINAEVDAALNTAIPGTPTANSVNERLVAIDDKLPSGNIGDATAANQTTIINATDTLEADHATILARLGAFTGTGVNTVLGFFKALMSKAASTPSDVGGTFSAADDSTEAIRDRGDVAWITGAGGDVWLTALPGAYGAGTAGRIIGDNLNATVGSRAAETSVDSVESSLSTLTTRIPDTLSLANINAEVDAALNTAIPGSPTADSINERVKAIDDKLPAGNLGDATAANQTTIINATDTVEANQTTILARLGVWTGTGVNTILGAFKALLSKTASNPSDIGGTFDPAADSTEAIRDRGDAAWITGGGGGDATAANQTTILTAIQAKREVKGSYNINGSGDIKVTVWLEDYNGSIANCSACTLTLLDHDGTTVIASGAWTVTATENTGNNTWFASKTAVVGLVAGEVYQLNVTLTHSATPYTGIIEVNAVA